MLFKRMLIDLCKIKLKKPIFIKAAPYIENIIPYFITTLSI